MCTVYTVTNRLMEMVPENLRPSIFTKQKYISTKSNVFGPLTINTWHISTLRPPSDIHTRSDTQSSTVYRWHLSSTEQYPIRAFVRYLVSIVRRNKICHLQRTLMEYYIMKTSKILRERYIFNKSTRADHMVFTILKF